MTSTEDFIVVEFDSINRAAPGGTKLAESSEEVRARLVAGWNNGTVDRPDEYDLADRCVRGVLSTTRTQRRATMRKVAGIIADCLTGGTLLRPEDEPLLRMAYMLGTPDGQDKTLIYWVADDWQNAVLERFRNAAQATAAAAEFDEVTVPIRSVLSNTSGTTGKALGL